MKYIKSFDESYLESNYAPLYHYTDVYSFKNIINTNILKTGLYDNIFKDKKIKMISLARNKDIDFSYYRDFMDIIIELDKSKLVKNYKIIPYDFFIHTHKETKTKDNHLRKSPFEFEEIILTDIEDIIKYTISVNFKNNTILHVGETIPILQKNNIIIYENGIIC